MTVSFHWIAVKSVKPLLRSRWREGSRQVACTLCWPHQRWDQGSRGLRRLLWGLGLINYSLRYLRELQRLVAERLGRLCLPEIRDTFERRGKLRINYFNKGRDQA